MLTAVHILFPQRLAETCDAIYQASFVDHHPVHEQACLLGLLENVHGKDQAQEIIRRVYDPRQCLMLKLTMSAEHK